MRKTKTKKKYTARTHFIMWRPTTEISYTDTEKSSDVKHKNNKENKQTKSKTKIAKATSHQNDF